MNIQIVKGQDIRPHIECGCKKYDKYKIPATEGLFIEEDGKSPEGTYTLEVSDAAPPNTAHITIYNEKGKSIYSESTYGTAWGFSPDEDRFVYHGLNQHQKHGFTLLNLNPNPATEGEDAVEVDVDFGFINISSSHIRFSPNGYYLLYAGIGNTSNLILHVYDARTGEKVFDGSNPYILSSISDESVAGWGFSPDITDATFVYAFQTDIDQYNLFVKDLSKSQDTYILKALNVPGGAYWRFSPCGDYFVWAFDIQPNNPICRFYKTNESNADYIEHSALGLDHFYTNENGHYIECDDGNTAKIMDNTANSTCDDDEAPAWSDKLLDTSNVTGTSLMLHWKGATDNMEVTGYQVYRNAALIKELEPIDSLEITELEPATSYDFKVKAHDAVGNLSDDGPTGTFTTRTDDPPAWPIGSSLEVDDVQGTRLTLLWEIARDDYGIDFYKIYRNGTEIMMIGGDSASYTVTGLTPEDTDTFYVKAGDAAGQWTQDSLQAIVTLNPDDPPYWNPGEKVTAKDITEISMILHWPAAEDDYGVTHYKIYQGDQLLDSVKNYTTAYSVKGLEEGTEYNFVIEAFDEVSHQSATLEERFRTLAEFEEDSLIVAPGDQVHPDIHGLTVAWENKSLAHDTSIIHTYDLALDIESQLTAPVYYDMHPKIGRERIALLRSEGMTTNIYVYDTSGYTSVLYNDPLVSVKAGLDIYEDYLVWAQSDDNTNDWDIYMYNLATEEFSIICDAEGKQTNPVVSGSFVVWEDYRNGNADIYAYGLNTGEEIVVCDHSADQRNPAITKEKGSSRIFYQDNRTSTWNLYYYTFWNDYERKLNIDGAYWSNQTYPHYADGQLVFQDDRNGNRDIYACEITFHGAIIETKPVSVAPADQINPRTSQGRIVWEDYRNGDANIYIWDRPPGSDLALQIEESQDPVGLNKTLEYEIILRNDGPDMDENIEVRCLLPRQAKYLDSSLTRGTVQMQGDSLKWSIQELRYDSVARLTLRFLTFEYSTLVLSASVNGAAFDPDPSNNKVVAKTTVRFLVPDHLGSGMNPDMTVQESGHVHVAYFNEDTLIYANKELKGSWNNEKLATAKGYSKACAITLDDQHKVHICYGTYDRDTTPRGRLYHMWQDDQNQWHEETLALTSAGFFCMNLEKDNQGDFHLVYMGSTDYIGGYLYYLKTTDRMWGKPQIIADDSYSYLDMALDEQNKPHICYYDVNQGILYQHCQNTGTNTWSDPEIVEPGWQGSQMEAMVSSISIDGAERPHITHVGSIDDDYRENIKHAWKDGDQWRIEKVDNGDFGSSGNDGEPAIKNVMHYFYNHHPTNMARYTTKVNGMWARQNVDGARLTFIERDAYQNNHLVYDNGADILYAMRPPMPVVDIHPDTLDFGHVSKDSTKAIRVTFTNNNERKLTIDSIRFEGGDCFKFKSAFLVLFEGESQTMEFTFAPTSEGIYDTYMKVYYNAPSGIFMDVPVIARTDIPLLKVTPDPVAFGAVSQGTQQIMDVNLFNEGSKDVIVDTVFLLYQPWSGGPTWPTDFSIISGDCDTIPQEDTCVVEIGFQPQKAGQQQSDLYIYSNDLLEPHIKISVTGKTPVPVIEVNTNTLHCGYVAVGDSTTRNIILSNEGGADLEIQDITFQPGADEDQFTLNHSCITIPPGDTCHVELVFQPTREGDMETQLQIASNDINQSILNIPVIGSSIERSLTISDYRVDFGTVEPGEDTIQMVTFENSGVNPVCIESISLVGGDLDEFSAQFVSDTLEAGELLQDSLTFKPIFKGYKEAYLRIVSNDSDRPTDTIVLTGIAERGTLPLALTVQADVTSGEAPLKVQFSSQITGGTEPYTYQWDFGDGGIGTDADTTHVFQIAGEYRVICTVTDSLQHTATDSVDITVQDKNYLLSGEIFDESGTTAINHSTVELYKKDVSEAILEVELANTNRYAFAGLDSGSYTVLVIPDTLVHQNTLPTYLGNKLARYDANYVVLDETLTGQEIDVIQGPPDGSGSGTIEGVFTETESDNKQKVRVVSGQAEGNAVAGCYVYLNESGSDNFRAFDITGDDGSFVFSNLASGTYQFFTDYKGMPMDESNPGLKISDMENPLEISVVAGDAGIAVETILTNVDEVGNDQLLVYPVPARDKILVKTRYGKTDFEEVHIHITDLTGKIVYISNSNYWPGSNMEIDLGALQNGLYIMTIQLDRMHYKRQIVKIR